MTTPASLFVALGLMLAGLGLGLIGLYLKNAKNPLRQRLGTGTPKTVVVNDPLNDILRDQGLHLSPALQRLLTPLAKSGELLAGTENDRQQLTRLLSMAGVRAQEGLGLLMVAKYFSGLLLVSALLFGVLEPASRMGLKGLAGGLIALFVGTTLPEAWLKWRAARRGGRLARTLPDGLDLMVICAEAGLPLGRVMQVVSKELALSAPELAQELRYTYAELQILSDRSKALSNLAQRTGVSEIQSMVVSLIQAERYGTPLSQALRTLSDESRKTLILGLEEKAGKLPAQMSIPLMTLILPPIVAMMGAPAMVRLVRMLSHS
ncbi:type II secretion system F family protein [Pseudomonas sp. FW300-N2F2]|uniref:type II secretion system F family protein n=1 Tax=Pseudomonas sp. FW300-N2F2 TaxID=2751320 RepID=UPI001A92CC29|nr:type II secretion system F family protein [Pseudomonas sp. FW300-N2F2]